jgi:hypothetical protein
MFQNDKETELVNLREINGNNAAHASVVTHYGRVSLICDFSSL